METITLHEREFVLGEPNVLHLVRLLAVVGHVGTRAEKAAADLGKGLLAALQDGEDAGTPVKVPASLFTFLAVLTPDDLLQCLAALLQFDNEATGVHWCAKHPLTLNETIQVIAITLRHTQGITEAIQNFTLLVGGLNLAALLGSPPEPSLPPAGVDG